MRLIQRYSPLTLRSARRFCLLLVTGVLWVSPLSAQQRDISIVPAEQTNNITVNGDTIVVNVEVMTDSVMIANLNRNLEALRVEIAAQECNTCGGSNVVRIGQGALVLIAAFMAWQVKKIADRGPDVHNDGDVTVPVTVESGKHDHGHDDDSESGESK